MIELEMLEKEMQQFQLTKDDSIYFYLSNMFEMEKDLFNMDLETKICLELFLLGANIKYKYIPFTYTEHMTKIKYIKDILNSDLSKKIQRVRFLNYGLK